MALPLGNRQPFRGNGGPFRGRNPWRQMGGPWGVSVHPWVLDATALAVRTAIRDPSAWGTTGAATGWLMPGTARLRLSGDSRASVTMARQDDGSYAWEPHNLLLHSAELSNAAWGDKAPMTVLTAAGLAPDGSQNANSVTRTGATGTYTDIGGRASVGSGGNVGRVYTFSVWAWVPSGTTTIRLQISDVNFATENSSLLTVTTTPTRFVFTSSSAWSASGTQIAGGLLLPLNVPVFLWGAQLNFGPTALAYVPTTAAARFAPGVEHEGGAWRVQAYAQATNRALWSRDLTNAAWVKTSCTAGLTATGIDGAANAASVLTATGANATCLQTVTHTSTERALSIFLRRRTGTGTVETTINGGTTWVARVLTSSWQRFETVATLANPQFGVRIVTNGDAVDVDVVQCEDGAFAGPPIPTQASTVTRTADAALALLPATIAAGTVVVDYIASGAGSQIVVDVSDGTANERHRITHDGVYTVTDGGVTQASPDGGTPNAATRNRVAIGWAANDFAVSLNGAAPVTDASGTVPTVDRILIGEIGAGVQRLRALDRKLPNGRIQSLAA